MRLYPRLRVVEQRCVDADLPFRQGALPLVEIQAREVPPEVLAEAYGPGFLARTAVRAEPYLRAYLI